MHRLLINKLACSSNWAFQTIARVDVSKTVETQHETGQHGLLPEVLYQHQRQVRTALFCSFLKVNGTAGMEQLQVVSLKLGQARECVRDAN